ncbi:MAG: PAS domain S-box-containing protein [Candidatus Binatia bacterium]|jgi:PAS domain S-box-containing protein
MPDSDSQNAPLSEPTLLGNLMDCLTYNVYFKDLESRFIRVNGAMARRLALSAPEDAAGKTDFDFFDEEHARQALADEQEIIRTGEPLIDKEESEIGPDGERRWMLSTKMPLRESDGAIRGTFGVSRDVTERKLKDQALIESEALYHTLVENLPLNVFRKDLKGRVTFGNRMYCQTTGKPLEEILGKTDYELYPAALADKYRIDDLQVTETGETLEKIEAHHTPDGRTIHVEVLKTPVHDAAGDIIGVQIIFWDVTARKEAEDALKNAKEELELRVQQRTALLTRANAALREGNEELGRANAELQDFAYIASHDLQEPLRKIQSFSARINDKFSANIPEQGQDYLTRMNNAANRMSGLISDLLELSRITTKANPFSSVDLNAVAREVVSDLEARIEQTGGRVDLGGLPTIEGDRTQLRQLLQNLISNALKFHRPDTPPVVTVRAESRDADASVRICVKDNGIGFDEKYASRIFTVFQRLHGKSAYEGTGIGLAICRKVVERHRGDITANSAPGEGATFLITLPVNQADQTETAP